MSENKVQFIVSADIKPASQQLVELQKEIKNIGNVKSVDKATVQQQRDLKKVAEGVTQEYQRQKRAYDQYAANNKKIEEKTALLQKEASFTKQLTDQYNELVAQQKAGTITPAGVNTLSRLSETIPHRLKEEEKLRTQINNLTAKNAKLDADAEQVLRHILGDEKEIVKDENSVLGLKIQKRAVTKDEAVAEDNLAKTAKKTGSAYSSQAKSAKDAGDALVKSTKANTTEIVKGTQLSQAAIEKLRNRAQQVLSKPMGPDKFTRGDLKRREKELLAVQKAMEAAGAPPKELDKEYEQLGIALDQVRQGMSALHKEARSSGKVAAEPVKEIKDEAAEAEQALKRAADQANKVLSQPATTEATTYGDLKRRKDEIIAAQKSIESVGKPKELDEQYERLQVELVKTDQALNAFNKDVRNTSAIQTEEAALRELQGTMEGIRSSVAAVSASMQAEPNTDNIAELIRRYNALREAKQGVEKLGMPTEMDETYATTLRLLAQLSQQINEYKRKLNGVDTEHKKAGKSINIFAVALRELRHSLASIGNGFQGLRRMAGRVRSTLNGLSKDMHRSFKQNITRITKYVLGFRSLFFLVRRLRKYLGEGIQNLVKFNNGNNKVNESITRLLSSLLYLKNAWAAAFSPIITAVTPWLEALIDKMAVVGNAVARFIGALTGQTVVFNAVKVQAQDYASTLDNVGSSAGGAADKAKKLKDRLAAFDDLNILGKDDDNDGSGSGGGGGLADAYAPDPNDMFTIVEAQSELADKIKKAWEESGFFGIGHLISQSIADWLGDVDWEDFKDDAQTLGKSFGDFFAGLFGNPDFWSNLGNAGAGLVNGLVYSIKGFLDANADVEYGKMIAEGFNNFLRKVDWKQAGANIHELATGILDNLIEFFKSLDTGELDNVIHDFLGEMKLGDIVWKLGELLVEAAKVIIHVAGELIVEGGYELGEALWENSDLSKVTADYLKSEDFQKQYQYGKLMATAQFADWLDNVFTLSPKVSADTSAFADLDFRFASTELQQRIADMTSRINEQKAALDATQLAWNELNDAQTSSIYSGFAEIEDVSGLYAELKSLVDASGRVMDGYELRAKFIIDKLSEALGVEIKLNDGVIEGLDGIGRAIDRVIEKKKAQIILNAQEEIYANALMNIYDAQTKLDAADKEYNRLLQEKIDLENAHADALTIIEDKNEKLKEHGYVPSPEEFQAWINAENLVATYDDKLAELNQDIIEAGNIRKGYQQTVDEYTTAIQTYEANMVLAQKGIYDSMVINIKDGTDRATTAWHEGLDTELSELTERQVEFKNLGNGMVQMFVDEVAYGIPRTREEMAEWATAIVDEISDVPDKAKGTGTQFVYGFNEGVNDKPANEALATSATSVGAAAIAALDTSLDTGSPSKEARKRGIWFVEGVGEGVGNQNTQSTVFNKIKTFGENLLSKLSGALKEHSPSEATEQMGVYLLQGLTNGITDEEMSVFNVVDRFGNSVLEAFSNVLVDTPIVDFINTLIESTQLLIDKLSMLSTLQVSTPSFAGVAIPNLAYGNVIPTNKEFLTSIEGTTGVNGETPLDVIKQAVADVVGTNGQEEVIRLLQQLIGVVESKNLVIGDKDIGKANARYVKQQNLIRGVSF